MKVHQDFLLTKNFIYDPFKFNSSIPEPELESSEYVAYDFLLNNLSIKFRVAKITPTKAGQFVTLWKRIAGGPIQPFDALDPIDLVVICARKDNLFGQFVFPKSVLCEHDVFSVNGRGGKRAIRVYPPWDNKLNRQAQKTQKWQMEYFLDFADDNLVLLAKERYKYCF